MKWSLRFTVLNVWVIRDRRGQQYCWHDTWKAALKCLNRGLEKEYVHEKNLQFNRRMMSRA